MHDRELFELQTHNRLCWNAVKFKYDYSMIHLIFADYLMLSPTTHLILIVRQVFEPLLYPGLSILNATDDITSDTQPDPKVCMRL
jgi:hypothetical protein